MLQNDNNDRIEDRTVDHNVHGRGLVMASLNIYSLLALTDELRMYMNNTKIDLLAINETKLDSTSEHSKIHHLPGY